MIVHILSPILIIVTLILLIGAICSVSHLNMPSPKMRRSVRIYAIISLLALIAWMQVPSCHNHICMSAYERILLDLDRYSIKAIINN